MKINRAALAQHLDKVQCGGQIEGAVFVEAFGTAALSPDHLLLVLAPSLEGAEPLGEPLGVPWLETVTSALRVIAPEGEERATVDVAVEDHRLVVSESQGVLRLLTAAPKTIATHIEPEVVEKLIAKAPAGDGIALTSSLVSGITGTFSLFKATEIELFLGPDGGKVRVGNENADVAEFPSPDLVAEEEYSLLFGRHLIDVFSTVTDHATARLKFGGPKGFVAVEDGGYRYILSPRSRGADA